MTAHAIERALHTSDGPALVAYLVGGYPTPSDFAEHLITTSRIADVVEVGIPFSDPLADGMTIQRASAKVLSQGVHLPTILSIIEACRDRLQSPVVLMSYLNPLLAYGLPRLARDASQAGVSGFIIPDLPFEESAPIQTDLQQHQLALIPLITPVTPHDRVVSLCAQAQGFVYAVTRTGVTGGTSTLSAQAHACLHTAKQSASVPVLAGFGVRRAEQVQTLSTVADGVIVGSALIECIDAGGSISAFLNQLRPTAAAVGGLR